MIKRNSKGGIDFSSYKSVAAVFFLLFAGPRTRTEKFDAGFF